MPIKTTEINDLTHNFDQFNLVSNLNHTTTPTSTTPAANSHPSKNLKISKRRSSRNSIHDNSDKDSGNGGETSTYASNSCSQKNSISIQTSSNAGGDYPHDHLEAPLSPNCKIGNDPTGRIAEFLNNSQNEASTALMHMQQKSQTGNSLAQKRNRRHSHNQYHHGEVVWNQTSSLDHDLDSSSAVGGLGYGLPNSIRKNFSSSSYKMSDKKSRSGVSLGICKNGGGGKFTWGKPGIEYSRDCPSGAHDFKDPNFDEHLEDENTVYDIYEMEEIEEEDGSGGYSHFTEIENLDDASIKQHIFGPFKEYLVNSDTSELMMIFEKLGLSGLNVERIYFHLLLWGLEAKKKYRGHVFVLIAKILEFFSKLHIQPENHHNPVDNSDKNSSNDDIIAASMPEHSVHVQAQCTKINQNLFDETNNQFQNRHHLFKALEDFFDARVELIIDHPDYDEYTQKMLGSFIYEYGSVNKNNDIDLFLTEQINMRQRKFAQVVEVSYSITQRIKSHKSIMSTIWIMDDYLTPEQLSYELSKLVDDWAYAGFSAKCLVDDIKRGVNTPHFYHELVKQLLIKVLNVGSETGINNCCETIKILMKSGIVERNQVKQGFLRVFNDFDELKIDIPKCTTLLSSIVAQACSCKIIDDEVRVKMPKGARGDRRRIISEMHT